MITTILRLAWLAALVAIAALSALVANTTGIGWPANVAATAMLVPIGFATVLAIEFIAGIVLGDGHWRGSVRAWAGEIVAALRTFALLQPIHGRRPLRRDDGSSIPVVLVHGYFCNRAVWRPYAAHLALRDHPFVAIELDSPFGPIERHAAAIVAAIGSFGPRPVVLVGHSMGGLAIRAALSTADAARVAGVVTLATPHRGTRLAAVARSASARQMRLDSAWIGALEHAERTRGLPPWTTILTVNDNIVFPQSMQTLPGAEVVRLGGLGHQALLYSPLAWQHVDAAIDAAQRRSGMRPSDPVAGPADVQPRTAGSSGAGLR